MAQDRVQPTGNQEGQPIPVTPEVPRPYLEVDLVGRIIKHGDRFTVFPDTNHWDVLAYFFQAPDTLVAPSVVEDVLLRGSEKRGVFEWGRRSLNATFNIQKINTILEQNLGVAPIEIMGATSNTRFVLVADVGITDPVPEGPPVPKIVPRRPFSFDPAPNGKSVAEGLQEALESNGFSDRERAFVNNVLSMEVRAVGGNSLLPDLNPKLHKMGFYVTVAKGVYKAGKLSAGRIGMDTSRRRLED